MNTLKKKKLRESSVKQVLKTLKLLAVVFFVIACAFFLFVNLVNAPNKGRIDKANKEKCEKIIRTLSAYKQVTALYPVSLDKLIPEYLSEVPLKMMQDGDAGRPFDYNIEDKGRVFILKYNEAPIGSLPSDSYFEYRSDKGSWVQKFW